jgi:hypothetical protein
VADAVTRHLRWAQANNDGVIIPRPGRIYCARLTVNVSGSTEVLVALRDGGVAGDPLLVLDCLQGRPDNWPQIAVTMPFQTNLYVAFSGGSAATRLLSIGWDTD